MFFVGKSFSPSLKGVLPPPFSRSQISGHPHFVPKKFLEHFAWSMPLEIRFGGADRLIADPWMMTNNLFSASSKHTDTNNGGSPVVGPSPMGVAFVSRFRIFKLAYFYHSKSIFRHWNTFDHFRLPCPISFVGLIFFATGVTRFFGLCHSAIGNTRLCQLKIK